MITLRPLQFVDLALKSASDPGVKLNPDGTVKADYFVIATGARVGALVYLLDTYRAQIPFPQQVRAMVREWKTWKSTKIGIEANAYQWALGQQAWEQGVPCVPVSYPGDKVQKWQLATPHFETGRVRIRAVKENGVLVPHPSMRRFVREALDAPFGDHDDTLDAITGLVLMLTSPDFQAKEFHGALTPGYSFATLGGLSPGRRSGDPFDAFKSPF